MSQAFLLRPANQADIAQLNALIARSALALGAGYYSDAQSAALTADVFGVDSQLIDDGTYFAIEAGAAIVACGGWGRRSTSYGGDQAKRAPERLLDPVTEAAKLRAFFVDPAWARRGLGSLLLSHCAAQAATAGFATLELVATMPGVPLYLAHGFTEVARYDLALAGGVRAPVARMRRAAR